MQSFLSSLAISCQNSDSPLWQLAESTGRKTALSWDADSRNCSSYIPLSRFHYKYWPTGLCNSNTSNLQSLQGISELTNIGIPYIVHLFCRNTSWAIMAAALLVYLSVLVLLNPNALMHKWLQHISRNEWPIIQVDEVAGELITGGHMLWGQRDGT